MSKIAQQLAAKVRARRGDMSLRAAELDSGVLYTTIRRVEHEHLPSVPTLAKLIRWANIDAGKLLR